MSLAAGTCLGPYEIVAPLGAGGMGEVYRAHDTRLKREVALKVLPTAVARDPDRLRRFEQEARAAAALNHPNILSVFDFGFDGDCPYVISELLEGETLRQRLAAGPLPVRKAVDYALQIAQGLAAAHQKGIVHRDLKPENLFLLGSASGSAGRVKILDFGLAKLMSMTASASDATSAPTVELATSPGVVMGTTGYMSPEQVRGKPVDPRSDIFSLGAVMYEMLSGRRAFVGESAVEALNAILNQEPQEFSSTGVQIPPALDEIVRHCLEKSPDERFQSARDLAFALERLSATSGPVPQAPPATPAKQRLALRPWLVAAGALVCVAAGVLAGRALWPLAVPGAAGYRFSAFATESRIQTEPSWSPDGSTLAFAAIEKGVYQIATRSVATPTRAVLTHHENDCHFPFWSPDGSRIYYLNGDFRAIDLWAVGAAGGAPERILSNVLTADILPDGRTFVFIRKEDAGLSLYRQSPPQPPVQYRQTPLSGGMYQEPYLRISPDGRQIGLSVATGEGSGKVWVLPVSDGAPRGTVETRSYKRGLNPLSFAWMPDSRHILYSGSLSRPTENHLILADTRSAARSPITSGVGQENTPAVSPDAARVAFGAVRDDVDIVEMPLDGSPPRGVLTTSLPEHCPSWSPTNNQFLYSREVGGVDEIWSHNVNEGIDRPVITAAAFRDGADRVSEPQFSPDGSRIVFIRVLRGKTTAWVMSAAGGPPVALVHDESQQIVPAWSPDGNSIAYYSFAALMRVSAGGAGSPVLIRPTPAMYRPRWSPRGDWITLVNGSGLSLISPEGQKEVLLSSAGGWEAAGFSSDGNRVAAIRLGPEHHLLLVSLDIASRKETVLTDINRTIPDASGVHGFSLAHDGRSFLTTVERSRGDIWMLDGFRP